MHTRHQYAGSSDDLKPSAPCVHEVHVQLSVGESTPSIQSETVTFHAQLTSTSATSSTTSSVKRVCLSTTPPIVDHVTSTSEMFSSPEQQHSDTTTETPLREFFARPFHREAPNKSVPRQQLIGFGESLTEEEAMERVRVMEEERKQAKREG